MFSVSTKFHPEAIAEAQRLLAKAGKSVQPHHATIGIHEDEGGQPKRDYNGASQVATLADVMLQHEFGAGVPERSFLRAWFDANVDRLALGMRDAMEAELRGSKTAVREWVAATHREWLDWIAHGGDFTGLMPQTIALKALAGMAEPATPLVATKQFIGAWRARLDGVSL